MSFSYNNDLSTDLDKVRFYIGDTVEASYIIEDEEITAVLASAGSVLKTCNIALSSLISKYSRLASETVGKVSVSYSGVVSSLRSAVDNLNNTLSSGSTSVYCGGISEAQKETYTDSDDIIQPYFKR